jgi:hypothetical protein
MLAISFGTVFLLIVVAALLVLWMVLERNDR